MRTALAALALTAVLAAGCGGGSSADGRDPVDALEELIAAATEGDHDRILGLLTKASRARVSVSSLVSSLMPFEDRHRIFLAEFADPPWGLVAVTTIDAAGRRGTSAYAAAVRREQGEWRFELGGPVRIRPIGPDPGTREQLVAQVAADVSAPVAIESASLWVDGNAVEGRGGGERPQRLTMFANLSAPLRPGNHSVVAFGRMHGSASARAWTFVVAP